MDLLTANDRAGEYPRSFYAADMVLPAERPGAEGAIECDVCIVGGGFTGLSAALHLAERGFDVVCLEAQRAGFGASGRNGGQVGTGQRRDQDWLEAKVGQTRARALWDLSLEAVALVRSLADAAGVNFAEGIIHADHRARYVAESHAYAARMRDEYSYDLMQPLDRDQIRAMVASDAYFGGTLDTGGGHIQPLRFALALADMAEAKGARIYERSRVTGIRKGKPCRIETGDAQVRARFAILAGNGYLGGLDRQVAAHVMPINNFIAATEPMSVTEQEALIAGNRAVADSKFVVNYFRFSEDRRLLFGGTESYGYRFPADIGAKVRRPMEEIFPQLRGIGIDHAWGGTLGITMNRMPYFERLAGNVLTLGGYSGHGVAMATLGGKLAAETIAGQAERFDLLASVPRHAFPGGPALRWPLLVLAMVWYSLRDRL